MYQDRKKLFYDGGGGQSKNVGQKIKKKKHWLKRLNAVPKKRNLDQNVNDAKCNIWNSFFFFLRILFRAYNFLYSSINSGGHHQSFF